MAKIDTELLKRILERNEIDLRLVHQVMNDIQEELEVEAQAAEERPPAVKKQFAILVSDPEGILPEKDLVGWVLQLPEEDNPALVTERLIRGAYEFNQSPKGRRMPARSIGEACEAVSAKFFKEQNVWVKTKEPVLVIKTNNAIPREKGGS